MELKTICTNCKKEKTWHVKPGFPLSQESCDACRSQGTLVQLRGK